MQVRPLLAALIASLTSFSECESANNKYQIKVPPNRFQLYKPSAEVASSSKSISGSLISALARATRCFCPPESCDPFVPQFLKYFSELNTMTKMRDHTFHSPLEDS